MPNLIKIIVDGTEVWIEAEEVSPPKGPQRVGVSEKTREAVESLDPDKIISTVKGYCSTIVKAFRSLPKDTIPNVITAEFGIKVSMEGTVYVVKAAGEASLKVTAEWRGKG